MQLPFGLITREVINLARNYVAISANGVTFGRDNLRLISVVYPSNCNCQKAENLKAEDQKLVI